MVSLCFDSHRLQPPCVSLSRVYPQLMDGVRLVDEIYVHIYIYHNLRLR